nr:hypothetical protein GCM10020185_61630 [Pseudomonas brassicacearum subsp. brassicacearum]
MQGTPRKILQAILYEAGGVLFVAPALALTYEQGMGYSTLLSLVISAVALAWNMLFQRPVRVVGTSPIQSPSQLAATAASLPGI